MYEKLKAVGIEHCFLIGIGAYNGTADDICYDEIRNAQYSFAEHRKDITVVSRLGILDGELQGSVIKPHA